MDNASANGKAVIKNVTFNDNGTLIYKGGENSAGNSLTLENNTFNSYNINARVQNLIFNNNSFSGGSYSFNDTKNTTFKGTNTLINSDPFSRLQGSITIDNNSIFNIERDLTDNTTYTLLSGNNIKYNNEILADNAFSKNLWNLIHYDGEQGTLLRTDNNTFLYNSPKVTARNLFLKKLLIRDLSLINTLRSTLRLSTQTLILRIFGVK